MANDAAPKENETGTVINQAPNIFENTHQSTARLLRTVPTATTAPTLQCVVDTGRPSIDAIKTVKADDRSITNPRDGVNSE